MENLQNNENNSYLITAPIDGFISKIQDFEPGTPIVGNGSQSKDMYLNLIDQLDKVIDNKNNQQQGTELDLDKFPSFPELGNTNKDAFIVIQPYNLVASLKIEKLKLKAAKTRLTLLNERQTLEEELNKKERLRGDSQKMYTLHQALATAEKAGGNELKKDLKKYGSSLAQSQVDIFYRRRGFLMNTTLKLENEVLNQEKLIASLSLKLLEANSKLGHINIPNNFIVQDIMVFEGQYVTKGEPIAKIKIN